MDSTLESVFLFIVGQHYQDLAPLLFRGPILIKEITIAHAFPTHFSVVGIQIYLMKVSVSAPTGRYKKYSDFVD